MTDSMNVKKNILLYAWQLPQNLLGALMFWWYRRNSKIFKGTFRDIRVLYSDRMRGVLEFRRIRHSALLRGMAPGMQLVERCG